MNEFAVDTVALVLRLEGRKLPPAASAAFREAEAGRAIIHVPTMALAEILYLSERGRIDATVQSVREYLDEHPHCQVAPLTLAVVEAAQDIGDIPELHDRLIAATAFALNVPLLTNDTMIAESIKVTTIW